MKYSYFGPVADKVVIDTGQFDRFGVISPKPFDQGQNRGVEVETQAEARRVTNPLKARM